MRNAAVEGGAAKGRADNAAVEKWKNGVEDGKPLDPGPRTRHFRGRLRRGDDSRRNIEQLMRRNTRKAWWAAPRLAHPTVRPPLISTMQRGCDELRAGVFV
jgi:hypothetical protein